jgi:hypothetical protein
MNRFILLSALAIMLCTAGLAVARVNWPAGWSVSLKNDSVVAQSPAVADGTVVFFIASPVERATSQGFAAWFDMKVRAAATNGTTIGLRQGTQVEEGTLYKDGYELRQAGKLFAYAFAFAYDTPQGRQFLLILRPKQVTQNDPRPYSPGHTGRCVACEASTAQHSARRYADVGYVAAVDAIDSACARTCVRRQLSGRDDECHDVDDAAGLLSLSGWHVQLPASIGSRATARASDRLPVMVLT